MNNSKGSGDMRTRKIRQFVVRLPDWLDDDARKLAQERKITVSALYRQALEDLLQKTPSMRKGSG